MTDPERGLSWDLDAPQPMASFPPGWAGQPGTGLSLPYPCCVHCGCPEGQRLGHDNECYRYYDGQLRPRTPSRTP